MPEPTVFDQLLSVTDEASDDDRLESLGQCKVDAFVGDLGTGHAART